MKKIISLILVLLLLTSVISYAAFAELDQNLIASYGNVILKMSEFPGEFTVPLAIQTLCQLNNTGVLSNDQFIEILKTMDLDALHEQKLLTDEVYTKFINDLTKAGADLAPKSTQTTYSFGQGTYVVGLDIQPGTYDVRCDSVSNEGYSGNIEGIGELYSGLGLDDYASAFDSMEGIYSALEVMTVDILNPNGTYADYLSLKSGETARVILEDGMKLELKDGTTTFTFIR